MDKAGITISILKMEVLIYSYMQSIVGWELKNTIQLINIHATFRKRQKLHLINQNLNQKVLSIRP